MNLLARFNAWRERRYWRRRHLDFVRRMVNDDWRWLGANPIADELTTRYRAALSLDWFKRQHENVSDFRERLCKQLGANTFSLGAPGNAGAPETCIHDPARPEGCYRVRCQLGKQCAETTADGVNETSDEAQQARNSPEGKSQ